MAQGSSQYIHGSHAQEQRRLTILNDLINEPALRELDLKGGERVLDVGSGLAQFSRMMALAVGSSGRVIGVERDAAQIEEATTQAADAGEANLVDLRRGEATALPLQDDEWGSFDIAFCRFVLEHVSEPVDVVRQMVRAIKPGGRVIIADDDHDLLRLWPELPEGERLWRAYIDSYAAIGNDPYVGRKLISCLVEAGATPTYSTVHFFGSSRGQATFDVIVNNLLGLFDGAKETMLQHQLIDESGYNEGVRAIQRWRELPDAAFWYVFNWAEGRKPVGGRDHLDLC